MYASSEGDRERKSYRTTSDMSTSKMQELAKVWVNQTTNDDRKDAVKIIDSSDSREFDEKSMKAGRRIGCGRCTKRIQ